MKKLISVILTLIAALSVYGTVMAQEQPTLEAPAAAETVQGVVSGTLVNGTAGAAIPQAHTITLHIVDSEMSEEVFTAVTAADGTYRFENVPIRADRSYLITTEYNDSTFLSAIVPGDPLAPQLTLPVTVYEFGADASAIKIDNVMMQVNLNEDALQIVQIVSFVNTSDRIFQTQDARGDVSVTVNMPTGATYQDFMGGGYYVSEDGTQVTDSAEVIPGKPHRMHLVYFLPVDVNAETFAYSQTFNYPFAGQFQVFFGGQGLAPNSDTLKELTPLHTANGVFENYGLDLNIAAGTPVEFELKSVPVEEFIIDPTTPLPQSINPLAIGMIVLGVGAIALAVVLFLRDRNRAPVLNMTDQTNTLMKQIAELDLQFQQGQIKRSIYDQQRSTLKAQLMSLVKNQKS